MSSSPSRFPVFPLQLAQTLLIMAAGLWVFQPSWRGPWLWDDVFLIKDNTLLHDPGGWWKIWLHPSQLIDFFPLTTTVEWLEWQLWGDHVLGFHLVTTMLHLANALLVWRLFDKLGLRLAWLGGLLFAIHPLVVESVAWVAELKNTLSLFPFLLAMCAWVDFDREGKRGDYVRTLVLFLVAMLCKPTMVMFPFVLLLYAWWRHGRVDLRDARRAIPFLLVSLGIGLATIAFVHPASDEHHAAVMNPAVRLLLAGEVLVFYFTKAIWPIGLLPIYPTWPVMSVSAAQLIPCLGLVLLAGACWMKRASWGRHVLLGLGFFTLNLLPFMGLMQGAFMYLTWVMDHVVYLPLIGIIGLVVAAVQEIDRAVPRRWRPLIIAGGTVLLAVLAWGSRDYAEMFANPMRLWTYGVAGNPNSWATHLNFGEALAQQGRIEEALAHFDIAHRIEDKQIFVQYDRAKVRGQLGQLQQAIAIYTSILEDNPREFNATYELANTLVKLRQVPAAQEQYERTLRLNPQHAPAHYALGAIMLAASRLPEAIEHFRQSLQIDASRAEVHAALAKAFLKNQQGPEALEEFRLASQLDPRNTGAHCDYGVALAQAGRMDAATEQFRAALEIDPGNVDAHYDLGSAWLFSGHPAEAIPEYEATLRLRPGFAPAEQNLAHARAMLAAPPANVGR